MALSNSRFGLKPLLYTIPLYLFLLVALNVNTSFENPASRMKATVGSWHHLRRDQLFVAGHEPGSIGAGRLVDFDPDFLQCTTTITRINRKRFLSFSTTLIPANTSFESLDPKDTQFGFVEWIGVVHAAAKVVKLN